MSTSDTKNDEYKIHVTCNVCGSEGHVANYCRTYLTSPTSPTQKKNKVDISQNYKNLILQHYYNYARPA